MSLFGGNISTKPRGGTLLQITNSLIFDNIVRNKLQIYLKSRREQHNVPSRTSWKMQLDLLCKLPVEQQRSQVDNAILRGWRAVAFKDSYNNTDQEVTRIKIDNDRIVAEGF